jgi:hypothetical protein
MRTSTRSGHLRGGLATCAAGLVIAASACQAFSGLGARPPTVDECATADETAQSLRKNGNLQAAKQQLAVCINPACPAPVREDCADRVTEVDKATPTILFDVKDSAGVALTAVTVVIDDTPLTDHLDGTPFTVDPGKHRFTFTPANGPPLQKEVVVREGEKGQFVTATLGAPAAVVSAAPSAAVATPVDAGAPHAPVAIGDDQKAAARLLGTEGVKMSLAGDCVGAVDRLTRAEALMHAPTTALPLARCQLTLGKIVNAIEILNRLVHETLPADAPKAWLDARAQAPAVLASAELRVAKLQIHVDRANDAGGADGDVVLTVDGDSVSPVLLDHDRPTDPGVHHVTASAPGFSPGAADVTLVDGQSASVLLRLEPLPVVVAATTATAAAAPVAPEPPSAANHLPAYVTFGVGAAGLLVGTVFGALSLEAKSHLADACNTNNVCPTTSKGDISAYHTDPIVSTIGLGVGLAAAAAGAYLWVSEGHDKARSAAHLVIRPIVAPGGAGVIGTFQ